MQCQSSELFAEVALRYCQKRGLGENDSPKFFFTDKIKMPGRITYKGN